MRIIKVVGAGFSGLITAYYLVKAGCRVRVVDSASRVGGMLQTIRSEHGLVETAANGVRNSARLEALCADIGVPLQGTSREARARFIYRGRPRRLPLTLSDVFRLMLRMTGTGGNLRPRPFETIDGWGKRVGGSGATEYFLAPALGGIYAGDPKRLSASLIFNKAGLSDELRATAPSRPKLKGTVAPPEGMQQLIDATWPQVMSTAMARPTSSSPLILVCRRLYVCLTAIVALSSELSSPTHLSFLVVFVLRLVMSMGTALLKSLQVQVPVVVLM